MNKFLFLLSLSFLTLNASAGIIWSDLVSNSTYRISKTLKIKNTNIEFKNDSFVKINEITNLPMLNVDLFKVKVIDCIENNTTSSLEIYDIEVDLNTNLTLGIEMGRGCELEIFVENKDVKKSSIFKL